MTRPTVRCRCGHRVLAKEVLRTDLYERPSGREYVYVKFRCKRCKRLGETFVAESRWDWRIFETTRTEMSESESEIFDGQAPICAEEILEFHRQLQSVVQAADLKGDDVPAPDVAPESSTRELNNRDASTPIPKPRAEIKRDLKDPKPDMKSEPKNKPSETGSSDDGARRPPRES